MVKLHVDYLCLLARFNLNNSVCVCVWELGMFRMRMRTWVAAVARKGTWQGGSSLWHLDRREKSKKLQKQGPRIRNRS